MVDKNKIAKILDGRNSSGLYQKKWIILLYWIILWMHVDLSFFWGAFPFLLVISWGSQPPNSGSPLAKVGAGGEKTQDAKWEEEEAGGKGVSGLLVSSKLKNWVGELRWGVGMPRMGISLHQYVCHFRESACLFQSECKFRESACLLQSECQRVLKKNKVVKIQGGRKCVSWERVHVCYSLCVWTCLHQSVCLFRVSICLH